MKEDAASRLSKVRCLNCFARISFPRGAAEADCPKCGCGWRISWVEADMPKIRGPVWDSYQGARE